MTVVPRRRPARAKRGRKALQDRYPVGILVQVYADFHDERYAERIGTVVAVHPEPDYPVYPRGRVEVLLRVDELYARLFNGRAPTSVWFKPADLERINPS